MTDTIEEIRARHEAAEKDGGHEWCGVHGPGAHADRATLLRLLSEERAAVNALPELLAKVKRLEAALRLFLEDDRFHVSVGGNPIAIEQMIGQARAALNQEPKP